MCISMAKVLNIENLSELETIVQDPSRLHFMTDLTKHVKHCDDTS